MKKPVRKVLMSGVVLAAAIVIVACAQSSGTNDAAATTAVTTEAETAEMAAAETTKAAAETEAAGTVKAESTKAETTETETAVSETTEAETMEAETTAAETTEAETAAAAAAGYIFVAGNVTVTMGAEAAPILEKLGAPEKTFEQDSCAYQGKDIVYTYKGFEISTYPADGKDCVSSVYVLDDSVSTAEGIKIGSTAADVREAYKDRYTEEFGVYRMSDDTTELIIYTTDDLVDGIEYLVVS